MEPIYMAGPWITDHEIKVVDDCMRNGWFGYGAAPENDGSDEPRDRLANQQHMSTLILALRALPQPVIAAVNGPAAGFGLALALGCDIRFAAPEAVFRAAFINIGVSNCDMATSWLLPRLIGASRSHELMLTGRRVGAEEALHVGLVAGVAGEEGLPERALEAAVQIASLAPWGVRLTKRGAWTALEIPSEQAAVEYEDRQQIMATHGVALGEAVSAFLEKREASFLKLHIIIRIKVVEPDHLITAIEQRFRGVIANEAGCAGDENTHAVPS